MVASFHSMNFFGAPQSKLMSLWALSSQPKNVWPKNEAPPPNRKTTSIKNWSPFPRNYFTISLFHLKINIRKSWPLFHKNISSHLEHSNFKWKVKQFITSWYILYMILLLQPSRYSTSINKMFFFIWKPPSHVLSHILAVHINLFNWKKQQKQTFFNYLRMLLQISSQNLHVFVAWNIVAEKENGTFFSLK